jgi:hypothetical protein
MEYDRDEVIAAFRDFYQFLAKMYLDASCIKEPPPGGWPEVTPEAFRVLNKTEEVISLLKHLPYIDPSGDNPKCIPFANFVDWSTGIDETEAWGTLICTEGCEEGFGRDNWEEGTGTSKISRFIGLTAGEHDDADVIVLDAQYGNIYWVNCPGHIRGHHPLPSELDILDAEALVVEDIAVDNQAGQEQALDRDDASSADSETPPTSDDGEGDFAGDEHNTNNNEDEDEDEERDGSDDEEAESDSEEFLEWHCSWPVVEFFEMLKSHYRRLNYVPESNHEVREGWSTNPEGKMPLLRSIYRKHGWPDLEVYQKEACLAEVRRVLHERWPEHYSSRDSE